MKRGYSILTRKIWGLDVNVWLTFALVLIVAISLLSYKVAVDEPCKPFDIIVADEAGSSTSSLFVNESIVFKTNMLGNFFWDFGDGFQGRGAVVKHSFRNSGRQNITVIMNGKCTDYHTVLINKDTSNNSDDIEYITGPSSGYIGKPLTFSFSGKYKPYAYEWRVADSREKIQTGDKATYQFTTSGPVTIELQLDHGQHKSPPSKSITIYSNPDDIKHPNFVIPTAPHGKKGGQGPQKQGLPANTDKNPAVGQPANASPAGNTPNTDNSSNIASTMTHWSEDMFKQKFEEVIAGKITSQDLAIYLFRGLQTPVFANNDPQGTVESFCQKIYRKKYKIESVTVLPDANHCVKTISVTYSKKTWLQKVF